MLGSLGRVSEAEAMYREAIASDHDRAAARATRWLARLLVANGRPEEGEAAYREVIDSTEAVEAGLALAALAILLESQL
jgi:tetratricopeptide (TPR) repeat protein